METLIRSVASDIRARHRRKLLKLKNKPWIKYLTHVRCQQPDRWEPDSNDVLRNHNPIDLVEVRPSPTMSVRHIVQQTQQALQFPAASRARRWSVADAAEVRKIAKYAELGRRFIFQPVAVETSGAMGKSTIQFFKDLGRRLAVRFQDQRESDFLFQRVSLAILRGNAFSILQSYRD